MNPYRSEEIAWQNYDYLDLDKNITHIFKIDISIYDKIENQYKGILIDEEIKQSTRFKQEDDRKRYIIGKFFLRQILSKILSMKPSDLIFSYFLNHKPYLSEQEFNISHSGQLIIIAISPFAVGVDVEFINPTFDFQTVLNRCFRTTEQTHIKSGIDFYTFWTRKEALLKATGEGIIDNLHDIDCSKVLFNRKDKNFKLKSFSIDNRHVFSLAYSTECSGFSYWNFEF